MSQDKEAGSPRVGVLKFALWGAALVGVAVVVYIIAQAFITPRAKGGLKDLARGEMARLVLPAEASAAPATSFFDADGKPVYQAMQAATTGDMAAAASLKQAASQIGRG